MPTVLNFKCFYNDILHIFLINAKTSNSLIVCRLQISYILFFGFTPTIDIEPEKLKFLILLIYKSKKQMQKIPLKKFEWD